MALQKTVYPYAKGPDFSRLFSWGMSLKNVSDLYIASGIGAHDARGVIQFPGDAVAQTRYVLQQVPGFLAEAGYEVADIVRIEYTFTREVPRGSFNAIFAVIAEFLAAEVVKPTAGTLRVVEALAFDHQLVEYEFWCAK
ncbi:2-iminobutanoate/2-iminopropanoate deaminase [Nannocystis exedens]|uniref:2-iminobutanoate/2-iminopropanoate deaminase n=2 Tax=Nannocystis exedens TaxID=54 RepID=A0A1I1XHB1_9BACT|nr:Rid family hydrolase [Nannocystis exedens]PCC73406.1 putative aminoacrylate peracid reductase RutC [Nannocystis exedens]SFE06794.1 2-iminobutanoate/2-iminopropanoate deaminase [Nannocystis exedens]